MIKKIFTTILLATSLLIAGTAAAQAYQIDPSYRPSNEPFALDKTIKDQGASGATIVVLQIIAGALLYFAAPIGIIMIAWSGGSMVIFGAEQEKLDAAKKHLIWSIVGLVVIILSYSLVKVIITAIVGAASIATTN
ncbi:MAG: hypothetical protein NTZ25_05005 [Candidatus Peregrinibacteria bacterium]|nr:hypothetical protein [Candidatus Peregrinibacteria bacterium]